MRRREFITFACVAAAGLPLAALAQQRPMPVIGLLNGQPTALGTSLLAAFRRGLAEMGFVESRNLAIVYRSADGNIERLREQAIELTHVPVAAIAAVGGDNRRIDGYVNLCHYQCDGHGLFSKSALSESYFGIKTVNT